MNNEEATNLKPLPVSSSLRRNVTPTLPSATESSRRPLKSHGGHVIPERRYLVFKRRQSSRRAKREHDSADEWSRVNALRIERVIARTWRVIRPALSLELLLPISSCANSASTLFRDTSKLECFQSWRLFCFIIQKYTCALTHVHCQRKIGNNFSDLRLMSSCPRYSKRFKRFYSQSAGARSFWIQTYRYRLPSVIMKWLCIFFFLLYRFIIIDCHLLSYVLLCD